MATKKKKPVTKKKKVAPKKKALGAKKPVAKKKPVVKKPVAKKKRTATHRDSPMHTRVDHPELEDEAHEEVFEIFKVYDRDGSGSIDRGEFARLLEALGSSPTEEELNVALDVVDSNHSGKISWDEFKAWWTNR